MQVGMSGQTSKAIKAKTGTGSRSGSGSFSVTGVGFRPDMVVIRGGPMTVKSDAVDEIGAYSISPTFSGASISIGSLDSDGFTATLTNFTGTYNYTWCAYKFS